MQIEKLILGEYENNCYIVRKENSADCIVIDTGLNNNEPLVDFLVQKNLNPEALVLTHGHCDHIAGIETIKQTFSKMKVCVHKADANMLMDSAKNLSRFLGQNIVCPPADILLEDDGEIKFAGLKFSIIHTHGHSPGGICLYNADAKVLFSGDALFANSIGRTDFPGYNQKECFEQLIENIRKKLLVLPEDTKVLPGHGPETTIKREKTYNPYLRGSH